MSASAALSCPIVNHRGSGNSNIASLSPHLPPLSTRLLHSSIFRLDQFGTRSSRRTDFLPGRCGIRVRVTQCSTSCPESTATSTSSTSIFGGKKELTGLEVLADKLPAPVRIAASILILSGALFAGCTLGMHFGKTRNAMVGGTIALGSLAGAAVYALNSSVPDVAAVHLHNYVATLETPSSVKREEIERLLKAYGVSRESPAVNAEMIDLYSRFVSSVLPPGNEELKGNESEAILMLKKALGIDDPDAATAHIEIGRRFFRQRLEIGDREADVDQRRAFQKLVYVSTLVFGEASTFLLPWKRLFKITDAQVEVAIRDNAQRLYWISLRSGGRDISTQYLIRLREEQLRYRLSDELARVMFRDHARQLVEANITAALHSLKSRTRTVRTGAAQASTQAIEELDSIILFNDTLVSFSSQNDHLAHGLGPVSLSCADEGRVSDLKLLYRTYAVHALSDGRIDDAKLAALNKLRSVFSLSPESTDVIYEETAAKVYRKRLSQSTSSGHLASAESKASFLQDICDDLHLNPDRATAIHEEIYRQKLRHSVAAKGSLTDADAASLVRLRVNLCIPQVTVDSAHSDICGSLFEKSVTDAIASGTAGFDADIRDDVIAAARALRLTRRAAVSVVSAASRKMFSVFVARARSASKPSSAAKELRDLLVFNSFVVTPLLSDVGGNDPPADSTEPVVVDDEWSSLETLRKAASSPPVDSARFQTEVTMRDDLPVRDRAGLYRTYLLYCKSGDEMEVGFGAPVPILMDEAAEYAHLGELGRLLGLTRVEIVDVHRALAEFDFRHKAEVVLADGTLNKNRMAHLDRARLEIGLPEPAARAVVKTVTTTKMAAALDRAVALGKFGMKEVRELVGSGVGLDTVVSVVFRERLFRKTAEDALSAGDGEFDGEEILKRIPRELDVDVGKSEVVVRDIARSRTSSSLVQAVSLLRQRNYSGVVRCLNDVLACDKALASQTPLKWEVEEEMTDLFAVYARRKVDDHQKVMRMQYLLGISDSTAATFIGNAEPLLDGAGVDEEEEFVF